MTIKEHFDQILNFFDYGRMLFTVFQAGAYTALHDPAAARMALAGPEGRQMLKNDAF